MRRFLADARHAFLIRRHEGIAASYHALYPDMSIGAVGLEYLHELHTAVAGAGGHRPVVIDSGARVHTEIVRTEITRLLAAIITTVVTVRLGGRFQRRHHERDHLTTAADASTNWPGPHQSTTPRAPTCGRPTWTTG